MVGGPQISTPQELEAIRRSRRHPRLTQPDYLHLRRLVGRLAAELSSVPRPVRDVLDVWCGSRPYDDLFPREARIVGFDVPGNPYGVADVVDDAFLPFADDSFDLVTLIEAFQYVADPAHAVRELERVLRPGGTVVVSLVFGFEYDRSVAFEARYTEQQLRALFGAWHDVRVREDGGRTVTWAVLTGSLLHGLEQRLPGSLRALGAPVFAAAYASLNGIALALERAERTDGAAALPMNLTLVAQKPRA